MPSEQEDAVEAVRLAQRTLAGALTDVRLANVRDDAEVVESLHDVARELRGMGYKVTPPPPPPPVNHCVVCGATDDDNDEAGYGPLVDITIVVADGKEGAAYPRRFICYEHQGQIMGGLIVLGFGVHRHGGINFLEPEDCPGFNDPAQCPTPVPDDADYEAD